MVCFVLLFSHLNPIPFVVQEVGEDLKEPRLVIYEENDPNSGIKYSSSIKVHDSEKSENAGDTTNSLENSRDGKYSQVYVSLFFYFLFSFFSTSLSSLLWAFFIQKSGTNHERKEEDEQFQQRGVSNMSGEKVCIYDISLCIRKIKDLFS